MAACTLAGALACKRPIVGDPTKSAQVAGGPQIAISDASIGGDGHLAVSFKLTQGGTPLSLAAAAALKPAFTLAALSTHPVDGLAAWKSLLLTGAQVAPSLPPGGPGTPAAAVITNARQPGSERNGTLDGADGSFRYVFANALPPDFDPSETLRVGVFLEDYPRPSAQTCATYDYRPAGGTPAPRDTVLDANCAHCHVDIRHHDDRVGVKLCLTCHTWQHSDPDTTDPAALYPASKATDPNPLELGRLVHRIHRGKDLPTLYTSTSTAPAPTLPSATALPFPFNPTMSGVVPRNLPIPGRRFSVIGEQGREHVWGEAANRYPTDPNLPPKAYTGGPLFPRDLRDCGACHAGAPQEYEVLYAISRRTCSGCHPETWYDAAPITDTSHFAHPSGPTPDDTQCKGCHVQATATQPKVYAPIAEIHVLPYRSPRNDRPSAEIVSVENLVAGSPPTVKFKLWDRVGAITSVAAPTPMLETGPYASPIPRQLLSLTITVGPVAPLSTGIPFQSTDPGNPTALTLVADANGVFTYTFVSKVPADATGTWAVGIEGRRRNTPTQLYDTATDTFKWPYTGEVFLPTESIQNPIVYVDTAVGTYTPGAPSTAVLRRTVVAQAKCERCHESILLHGTLRNKIAYCTICHTPYRTDWGQRPKLNGNVNLAATMDGIEERSIELKVLIHRIHTGARKGAASLDAIDPFFVYGVFGGAYPFDEGTFPNDLRDCTRCHEGTTYRIESIPADAPWNVANETDTVVHQGTRDPVPGEPTTPPIQAACFGCHATGAAMTHAAGHTIAGVEQCGQCHSRGSLSVDVVHGLASADAGGADASFSSIVEKILVPRCASAACHGGSPPAAFPRLDAAGAYEAIFQVPSQQASGVNLVQPFAPEQSYLLLKVRGDAASVGGVSTRMPLADAPLDASDVAAIEAWIANGAQQ